MAQGGVGRYQVLAGFVRGEVALELGPAREYPAQARLLEVELGAVGESGVGVGDPQIELCEVGAAEVERAVENGPEIDGGRFGVVEVGLFAEISAGEVGSAKAGSAEARGLGEDVSRPN